MSVSDLLIQMELETDSSYSERNQAQCSLLMSQQQEACSSLHSKVEVDGTEHSQQHFILVGLHTCGDLASTMFRLFSCSNQIVGLVSVGCCYMKLTCSDELQKYPDETVPLPDHPSSFHKSTHYIDEQQSKHMYVCTNNKDDGLELSSSASAEPPQNASLFLSGYPMSTLVRSLPGHSLSYEAREVACHSIEVYLERCVGNRYFVLSAAEVCYYQ